MPTVYEYHAAVLYAIDKIGQGYTPTRAVREANITMYSFKRYVDSNEELRAMLDEATDRGADTMADMLLHLSDPTSPYYCVDPKEQKIISDNIKWLLARRFSKKFGEKVEVTIEATIQHVIVQQLENARMRSQQAIADQRPIIDAEFSLVPPAPPQ